jgi:ADP-heptose:LPS heptosyltransferase
VKTDTKFLIDRTIALPLAWAANVAARTAAPFARRDHTVDPQHIHTIAVAKLLGMGSIIQATPLLHDLRRSFPKAKIVFLTTESNRGLIERLDLIDEGIYVDDADPAVLATTTAKAIAQLLSRKIDLYFDLEIYSAGASVLSVLSGARNRVGFYRGSARFKKGIYTHLTVFNPRAPIAAIYRQLHLSTGGKKGGPARYGPIVVRTSDVESLAKATAKHGLRLEPKYVVVNPNASDLLLERRWPMDKYVQLIVELAQRGEQIVLVGAKSEQAYVGEIIAKLPASVRSKVVDTSGKLSLGELFALIKGAAVVVTNDTGPMHFSIALDRPTVCLFGPVSPDHYGVRKANVETLYHAVYCSPCAHEIDTPPCAGVNVCMQLIEVPEVLAAVQRQLEGKSAPVRLPILDVAYAAPQGGALGVIVRSSVETAHEGSFAADHDSEPPVSEVIEVAGAGADSRVIPR